MAAPIIKFHKVPNNFAGIDNVLHKQSETAPDIVYGNSTLLPIEEAVDATNTGNPGAHEPSAIYKINLVLASGNDYYPTISGIAGKEWVINHMDYEPRVFVKRDVIYYGAEIWEYEYINRLNEDGEENYEILSSGIRLKDVLLDADPTITNNEIYATFFYWENSSYAHPTSSNVRGYFMSQYDDYVNFAPFAVTISGADVSTSGDFLPDNGVFRWTTKPSGVNLEIDGYYHTWQRLTNDNMNDLLFDPGEEVPAQISNKPYLVKDFTENGPWYRYADVKISNESSDTSLEKFFAYPILRGKLNTTGYIYEGWAGYTDPSRPWDTQEGQALETIGYSGLFSNTTNTFTMLMWEQDYCWASGISPSSLSPSLSGLDPSMHYNSQYKFPAPCSGDNTSPIITYYRTTRQTPDGRYAFAYSRDVIDGHNNEDWLSQHPSGAQFKILQSGVIANDGFPVPDSVYVRCLYTLRNFDFLTTQGYPSAPYNYSAWSTNPQFQTVSESDGLKAWTLTVTGTYYE